MGQEDQLKIFELGKAIFDNGKYEIYLEEVTVNVTRDLAEYYTTDSFDAKEIRPGRKKIDFTIRKARDLSETGMWLTKWFASTYPFTMTLYALNVDEEICHPRAVATLEGCRLSKSQLGNFDASKPVQEDIEGKAYRITWFGFNGERVTTPVCAEGVGAGSGGSNP
jgi:hypothetical protein